MRIGTKQIICLTLVGFLLFSTNALALKITNNSTQDKDEFINKSDGNNELKTTASYDLNDLDPNEDLSVTVTIKEIRALDKIGLIGKPNFYVKVSINDAVTTSRVWRNNKYLKPNWSVTQDVPDDEENVKIKIQLWDWNLGKDKLCDISSIYNQGLRDKRDIDLVYSLKTGHWRGDDFNSPDILFDSSGYGRANGCDDNSIYQRDRDCELWFDISQNDTDGDGIPYWTEYYIYETDPKVDNSGMDDDVDGVPIEWEHKWGHYFRWNWHNQTYRHHWIYDPFEWDDHENLDPDEDGLQNIEEYLTSQWGSDPFRQDIFLEVDQMKISEDGRGGFIPDLSKELLRDAFGKHNIVFLVDDGCMGGGQKTIPFDPSTTDEELQQLYMEYFLNNDTNNWRRGAFHYCLIIYHSARYCAFSFGTKVNGKYLSDSFQLSTDLHEFRPLYKWPIYYIIRRKSLNKEVHRAIAYASVMMHETGHTLGIYRGNTPGCDVRGLLWALINWNYRSCMNYGYVYYLVDYSNGSHGKRDFDDWDRIDLTRFQIEH